MKRIYTLTLIITILMCGSGSAWAGAKVVQIAPNMGAWQAIAGSKWHSRSLPVSWQTVKGAKWFNTSFSVGNIAGGLAISAGGYFLAQGIEYAAGKWFDYLGLKGLRINSGKTGYELSQSMTGHTDDTLNTELIAKTLGSSALTGLYPNGQGSLWNMKMTYRGAVATGVAALAQCNGVCGYNCNYSQDYRFSNNSSKGINLYGCMINPYAPDKPVQTWSYPIPEASPDPRAVLKTRTVWVPKSISDVQALITGDMGNTNPTDQARDDLEAAWNAFERELEKYYNSQGADSKGVDTPDATTGKTPRGEFEKNAYENLTPEAREEIENPTVPETPGEEQAKELDYNKLVNMFRDMLNGLFRPMISEQVTRLETPAKSIDTKLNDLPQNIATKIIGDDPASIERTVPEGENSSVIGGEPTAEITAEKSKTVTILGRLKEAFTGLKNRMMVKLNALLPEGSGACALTADAYGVSIDVGVCGIDFTVVRGVVIALAAIAAIAIIML